MKYVVWGIIGCGNVTEIKSGPAFQRVENSALLAVMRRNKEKVKDYAMRHNIPEFYYKAESILKHNMINSVYIATPPSSHLDFALRTLDAKKNVYLEKPMTLNAEDALTLSKKLKRGNSKLTLAHYRRQLPMFLKIKHLLYENRLGTIKTVQLKLLQSRKNKMVADRETNWRLNPAISGGGYFHDLAPHQLDLMIHWFGNIKSYRGHSNASHDNLEVATRIEGTINFECGITFSGLWNFNVPENNQKDECIITGDKGWVKFSVFGNIVTLNIDGKTEILRFEHPKHIQEPMIRATVNYFLGKSENPCPAEEGLKVMEIMDAFTK